VSKYTVAERETVKGIVANLTIKRIPDSEIIKEVFNQTGKTKSRSWLYNTRQSIKRDSYKWYSQLKQGEYEYLHEFKERINEIMDLQKKLHSIIDNNEHSATIQIDAIAELHKLNITLSNYFSVAPSIGNVTVSTISETKAAIDDKDIIV
jgi:hypothetical protein